MRNLLLGTTALLAMAAPAAAADLPIYRKAPPPPPSSWTGFYVGGEVGGKWADATWTTTSLSDPAIPPTKIDTSSPADFRTSSIRAGGYFGYNWQFAPQWVGGVEFDIAYADKTATMMGIPGCTILCIPGFPGPVLDQSSVRFRSDESARARLGFLINPTTLLYGAGGIAWQNIQASATCQHSVPDPLCNFVPGNPFATATDTFTRAGWTAGGGIELLFQRNWIARAEYRYSYFGPRDGLLDLSVPSGTSSVGYQLKANTQIATFGLAYKFGGPLVTKY
jgi:outer membrane immunogenic protein